MPVWLIELLFPPRADERHLREVSTDVFCALLAPSITEAGALALLPLADTSGRAAIHEAKYHGSAHAFSLLAAALADALPGAITEQEGLASPSEIILVPVPLGAGRLRERGFNQVEEVARKALPALAGAGMDVHLDTGLLARTRETVSQVLLSGRARRENMRGAFLAARAADPSALYVLLDDVTTTGATLSAASDALRAAGTERILLLALAH